MLKFCEVSRNLKPKKILKISAFYLDKQKSFVSKKKCSMLVIKTLKWKISDFLSSNTCFCSQLYGKYQKMQSEYVRPKVRCSQY